ncbi:MAG: DUF4388 domain-containing protein [Planctomycetota bacterium]|jgi:hypothetical protein
MDDGHSIVVMMPKIARKTLGLSDAPFSRVHIEDGGICFSGDSFMADRSVAVPASMLGTFHHDLLNNLFVYLSNTRQNGMLVVSTGPLTKVVFFKHGQIVFAGSTDASERIGNVLVSLGYATQEQVDEIAADDDPRRFGVRMKEKGLIDYDQLWDAIRVQITDICCSLVRFPVGSYFFLPNVVPDDAFSHFLIEPTQVLFQGMIEMDERLRYTESPTAASPKSLMEAFAAMEAAETGTGSGD